MMPALYEKHYCPDWDFALVDPNDPGDMNGCLCGSLDLKSLKRVKTMGDDAVSLRDYFAGCALSALIASESDENWDIAKTAYSYADQMLYYRDFKKG